jgi:hypothetical protein
LVSFPPLIDMLKFSGYPYLIRGQPLKKFGGCWQASAGHQIATSKLLRLGSNGAATDFEAGRYRAKPNTTPGVSGCNDARTGMPPGIPEGRNVRSKIR